MISSNSIIAVHHVSRAIGQWCWHALALSGAMRLAAQTAPATPPAVSVPVAPCAHAGAVGHPRGRGEGSPAAHGPAGHQGTAAGADAHNPKSPNAVNYDESKASVYPSLPDPLLLKNGKRVTSAKLWWTKRRPEIVEDFDREILGRAPPTCPK
jgi:hypothetical protein